MPKNYLAIDYGERRVGIAYASELVGIAFPRETIDLKEKNLVDRTGKALKRKQNNRFHSRNANSPKQPPR